MIREIIWTLISCIWILISGTFRLFFKVFQNMYLAEGCNSFSSRFRYKVPDITILFYFVQIKLFFSMIYSCYCFFRFLWRLRLQRSSHFCSLVSVLRDSLSSFQQASCNNFLSDVQCNNLFCQFYQACMTLSKILEE